MADMLTVFKTEVKDERGNTHKRKVEMDQLSGHVNITTLRVGPRGGVDYGLPGFTADEWMMITKRIADVRTAHGTDGLRVPSDFFYPGA